ncbi:Linear gramicidin synthase subunit D [Lachnellula subtilissima]|uniref:Linear gramicidin synthase subunit D n=1 Tax=Lachnellula subtilissima TaxID=602034 RepID=A0A8H8RU79_9HELO|nr:Linear gramicidin synthase subunit D [Lachnellula subtilissima]
MTYESGNHPATGGEAIENSVVAEEPSVQVNNQHNGQTLGRASSVNGNGEASRENPQSSKLTFNQARNMPVLDINKDLTALVSQQIRATPDAIALEDETTTLTYAELDKKVDALARRLRAHKVSRDVLVGVLLGRSADYVIACLAALRAGGAFLVLEFAYPPGLLADVVDDARPAVVITSTAQAGKIKADVPLIVLDEPRTSVNGSNGNAEEVYSLPDENDLEKLAFVSYSSGTTGKPKGIANPQRAPILSYDLRFRVSDIGPGDRVACNVFFIWEMLRPLLRGATVYAVPDEASYDPVALVDLLSSKRITETLMTPTLLAAALSRNQRIGKYLPDLRTLWLNGEVVTTDLAQRAMKALPNTRLLNVYSASETHEVACGDIREIIDKESIYCPVGPSVDPEHTYILNESGEKVEPGISGELFVGGSLLARGYLNLPESTTKAFKPDPFDKTPGAKMYRTGDLARMLPGGLLEITGRVGAMIKVRGYSIVPGKIENAIVKQLAVSQCAVTVYGDGLERQVVAYVVRDKEDPGDRTDLVIDGHGYSPVARQTLSAGLAQYMIPALWVELEELPTHEVSGKVDLKRLPSPVNAKQRIAASRVTKKESDTEITTKGIAELWAASLNTPVSTVTQQHSFFDLGGHSLTLADLATRMSRNYGFPVPLGQLAVNPTLEGHLEVVRSARDGRTAAVQAELPSILRADSILPEDIQPSKNGASWRALNDADTVLVTGTTGFLGAFLLSDLLETTTARIICLVRFDDPTEEDRAAAVARIRKNLLDHGLWNDRILDRIEVIPGTLGRKRLGLSPDAYEHLVSRVHVIIHAGATVNLVYPYAALRDANVGGTREILRLASHSGATVQYVSTNGVLPPSDEAWSEDAMIDVEDVPGKLVDGYGQTKWVAEKLAYEASARGMPVRIIRLGTISGHSTTGAANAWDLFMAIIVESLHIGYAPDIEGWRAEMTPVDFVSRAITTLSNNIHTKQRVFHVGDSNPVNTSGLFDDLKELGYPTERLGWDEWVALWSEKRGSAKRGAGAFTADILRGGMPDVDFLKRITVLNDTATKPALSGIERPKIDHNLLETYARHWCGRGWLAQPPRRNQSTTSSAQPIKKGPLSGLVAVVTGASSGIGAAVATQLAREGAHIALAARRTDALETLKAKLAPHTHTHGSKVLIHKTDVTSKSDVDSLLRTTTQQLGPVDIVVSCAGVMYFTMMANVQAEEWERTVDVNCKGLLHMLAATVPPMLARGKGHIVAISSDAGRKVFPGLGVYSASKFFVEATLQALRLETAGSGLRVTSMQPGNTATELLGMSTDAEALKKFGEPSGARVLDAEDVARAVVYALMQPEHVAVNEVLIEPRDEPI